MNHQLPPGQHEIETFPRFGLHPYATRLKKSYDPVTLNIIGDVKNPLTLTAESLKTLPRIQQKSDFHCVTTWTKRDLRWSGYRFADLYQTLIKSQVQPSENIRWVIFRSLDGFRAILLLEDLLAKDVLLADTLDNQPLTPKHGAPLRLIAPAHYGYKSAKHLKSIEFWEDKSHFKPSSFHFMHHYRARVQEEERGQWIPARILRWLYYPLIKSTISLFQRNS